MIALVSAVEQEHQAVVSSAAFAFRSTGLAMGLTVASAAFQKSVEGEAEGKGW